MIFGLVLGVAILIFLVLKTKIHAFLALIIAASITGLVGGMSAPDVINAITAGFGSTLGSIGIVIGFGVMMGRILEVSGAAEKMAYTLVKWVGKRKEEWAMAITGYGAGLAGRRSMIATVAVVVAFSAVILLIADLDRPQEGFLRVSQQTMLDLQTRLRQP